MLIIHPLAGVLAFDLQRTKFCKSLSLGFLIFMLRLHYHNNRAEKAETEARLEALFRSLRDDDGGAEAEVHQ